MNYKNKTKIELLEIIKELKQENADLEECQECAGFGHDSLEVEQLKAEVEELESKIDNLEVENDNLQDRLDELKSEEVDQNELEAISCNLSDVLNDIDMLIK